MRPRLDGLLAIRLFLQPTWNPTILPSAQPSMESVAVALLALSTPNFVESTELLLLNLVWAAYIQIDLSLCNLYVQCGSTWNDVWGVVQLSAVDPRRRSDTIHHQPPSLLASRLTGYSTAFSAVLNNSGENGRSGNGRRTNGSMGEVIKCCPHPDDDRRSKSRAPNCTVEGDGGLVSIEMFLDH
nr:hypothetical protein CFP56_73139 [Quercus suber]